MFRGIVSGLLWGGVVSVGILSFLSLSIPAPGSPPGEPVADASAVVPQEAEPEVVGEPQATAVPAEPAVAASEPGSVPEPIPSATTATATLEAAPTPGEAIPTAPATEAPPSEQAATSERVLPAPSQSLSPPVAEGAAPKPIEAAEPAAPGVPDIPVPSGVATTAPASWPTATPVAPAQGAPLPLTQSDAPAPAIEPPGVPLAEAGPSAGPESPLRPPLAVLPPPAFAPLPASNARPQTPAAELPATETAAGSFAETVPGAAPEAAPETTQATDTADASEPQEPESILPGTAPRISGGAGGFTSLAPQIPTNRLPSVGGGTTSEAEETATGPQDAGAVVSELAESSDASPVERFAVSFVNPDGKPLLAVILLDDGTGGVDRQALASLPIPVAFAVSASRPDAVEAAAAYRAAGFEVVILADAIPVGASPSDLEVAFAAFQSAMPEAVAVIDRPQGGFQGNRSLSGQVAAILKESGHGLVTHARGLNAAADFAAREGVPSVMVFRDLDAADENSETIRRYLDRAAFRAAQDGRAVVMGRARAPTVTALFAWGAEMQRSGVALAPLSAVLMETVQSNPANEGN